MHALVFQLANMSAAAGAAGRPSATYDIARDLGNLMYRQEPALGSNPQYAASPAAFTGYAPRLATGGTEL